MKKKIFGIFAISLLTFMSCFDSKIEIPPTHAGVLIYQDARLSNNYVMFCVDLAFKLNVLLEAREGDQPLEDVLVTLSVDSDGELIEQDKGVNQLFKNIDVSFHEESYGVWKLVFIANTLGDTQNGSILISTDGELLSNPEALWSIDSDPSDVMSYGGGAIVMEQGSGIKVQHLDSDDFLITVRDFGLFNLILDPEMKIKTKWNLDFNIQKNSSDYSLMGMRNSLYEITGDAGGTVARYGESVAYKYEIEDNVHAPSPLKYKYSKETKKSILYGGTEIVNAPNLSTLYPDQFPTSEVFIEWKSTVGGTVYYDLSYNGHSMTTTPQENNEQ